MAKLGIDSFWLDKNQVYSKSTIYSSAVHNNYIFMPGNLDLSDSTIPMESFI